MKTKSRQPGLVGHHFASIQTPAQPDAKLKKSIAGLSPKERLEMAALLEADAAIIRQHVFFGCHNQNRLHLN